MDDSNFDSNFESNFDSNSDPNFESDSDQNSSSDRAPVAFFRRRAGGRHSRYLQEEVRSLPWRVWSRRHNARQKSEGPLASFIRGAKTVGRRTLQHHQQRQVQDAGLRSQTFKRSDPRFSAAHSLAALSSILFGSRLPLVKINLLKSQTEVVSPGKGDYFVDISVTRRKLHSQLGEVGGYFCSIGPQMNLGII